MERLTYWNEEYGCWSYHCASGDAAEKLAAYEDTGLEPSEIPTGLELASVFAAMQELKRYNDAEEQGRLVMLPCNVGTTVYVNRECLFPIMTYGNSQVEPCEVIAFSETRKQVLAKITTHKAQAENSHYSKRFPISSFGKTVFFTRQAAEAALAETTDTAK